MHNARGFFLWYAAYMSTRSDCINAIEEHIRAYGRTQGYPDTTPTLVTAPTDSSRADLTISGAFHLAKVIGKNPMEVAKAITSMLQEHNLPYIEHIEAVAPGFVNIRCANSFFVGVLEDIKRDGDSFGSNSDLRGQTWALEHTSPNPNKAMHVGHLRNNVIGMSLVRICEYSGARVIAEAVDNNRGIAIAKAMQGFLVGMRKDPSVPADPSYWVEHKEEWYTPGEKGMLPDVFVTACYIQGEREADGESVKAQELVVLWEKEDAIVRQLWEYILAFAYAGQQRTLARLGNRFDVVWHEHEHYTEGKRFVKRGVKEGVFTVLKDGAVRTNLSAYHIPDTIVLKKDGTSLYLTQDIALTAKKKEKHRADTLMWVVGSEQTLALRQLFAICEQLGIGKRGEFFHISYGYVRLKKNGLLKKMSSREGTVVLIDDVLDAVRDGIHTRFLEDGRKDDAALRETSESLARSAVFFSMLKIERTQDMSFDVKRSVDVRGDSGMYVLYSFARARSILCAAKKQNASMMCSADIPVTNRALVLLFSQFEEVVARALKELAPHHIARYLLDISTVFNAWYARETVLDGSTNQPMKLRTVRAFSQVTSNALRLLHIEPIESL